MLAKVFIFRGKDKLGNKTKLAFDYFSNLIPFIESDEIMYPHIHKIEALLKDNQTYNLLFKGDGVL